MKYNLNLIERIALLDVLPKQGNIAVVREIKKLRENLIINEEEMKKLGIKAGESFTITKELALEEKEVEVNEFSEKLIKSKLESLDKNQQLNENYVSVYDKFIGG